MGAIDGAVVLVAPDEPVSAERCPGGGGATRGPINAKVMIPMVATRTNRPRKPTSHCGCFRAGTFRLGSQDASFEIPTIHGVNTPHPCLQDRPIQRPRLTRW